MLHHHIPYEYVDAIVDRRTPKPARLLELASRRSARRARRRP
jgi:hypothetical protein